MTDFTFKRRKLPSPLPAKIAVKWSQLVLDEGFVPFPKRLLRCLTAIFHGPHAIEELVAVLAIVDFQRPKLSRGPSIDFLAFTAGLPVALFVERTTALEKRGLLSREGPDQAVTFALEGLLREIVRTTEWESTTQDEN